MTAAVHNEKPRTSTRDHSVIARRLSPWLRKTLGADGAPVVHARGGPSKNGMSSDTVLIDVDATIEGVDRSFALVVRLPPPADAFPVFPDYDLARQADVMQMVASSSTVPVPTIVGFEPDPGLLGAPFLVMTRIDGIVAPDMLPYPFGSWLSEADSDAQRRVESAAVDVLVGIHGIGSPTSPLNRFELAFEGNTALERHVAQQRQYFEWARRDRAFSIIERVFQRLNATWPDDTGDVLSWGDARLGNIMWSDFRPVAVLDWESVAVAPREVDLGWMVFFHAYFQEAARGRGIEGMPTFMRRSAVEGAYTSRSGHAPRDFDWYLLYAALRQALVSIRVRDRAVAFGETPPPADVEDLIMQLPMLQALADGTYDWT